MTACVLTPSSAMPSTAYLDWVSNWVSEMGLSDLSDLGKSNVFAWKK